jgi:hypothetical protein
LKYFIQTGNFVGLLRVDHQAEVVRQIFDLYLNGLSSVLIFRELINNGEQEQFLMKNAHEPIIDHDKFEQVQAEMKMRSNIDMAEGTKRRKNTHYSSKQGNDKLIYN